jgi:hypothetical protein
MVRSTSRPDLATVNPRRAGLRAQVVTWLVCILPLSGLIAGCGSSSSTRSSPVAFSTTGWETLAGDVHLTALRSDPPQIGTCKLIVAKRDPKILTLSDCGAGRGGILTTGGRPRPPACSKESARVSCSVRSGVSVTVEAPRASSAIALLRETIEVIDEETPDDAVVWGIWLEPNLNRPKGSLTLAGPRHLSESDIRPCAAGKQAAVMLGSLEVSKRTARHVAERGVHILMIEKPAAVRSFSMAIGDECRKGRAGTLRGAAIVMPMSRVERFVLVIPNYFSVATRRKRQALLRGLMLEPKLYRGEKHNDLPETMLSQSEDREATGGELPLLIAALSEP